MLVFFELNGDLAAVPLVIGGAIAAACGRLTLAWASGRCRGRLAVPLVPLALAFFAGRLVSYSIYVGGATLAQESLGDAFAGALTSPVGIALQLAMLAALVGLVKIDWAAIATRRLRAGRP